MALDFTNTNSPMNFESGGLLGSYSKNYNSVTSTNPTLIENTPQINFYGANASTASGQLPASNLNPMAESSLLGVNNPIVNDTPIETATTPVKNNTYLYLIVGGIALFMFIKKGE